MRRVEFEAEGLGVERVVDKLRAADIPVLAAEKTQKNGVRIAVEGKHRKKVFAILRSTCYNVTKVRARGAERFLSLGVKTAGLLVGAAIALSSVLVLESRVLRIEVVGSGAYYEAEVREILSRGGVEIFSPAPKEKGALTAEILSLPRVSFCSFKKQGAVLTVDVEVAGDAKPLEAGALISPAEGILEEMVVIRGTPNFAVGDSVKAGDVLVSDFALYGEEQREVIVIARAKVGFPVRTEYALGEEGARFQAFLDYGDLTEIHTEKTENGCILTGYAHREAALNFG